jgi:hypothetical protein
MYQGRVQAAGVTQETLRSNGSGSGRLDRHCRKRLAFGRASGEIP